MACMLSSFLLCYADSHALSSLSDNTGFWRLTCQLWLQTRCKMALCSYVKYSSPAQSFANVWEMRLSTSSSAVNCPGGVTTGRDSDPFISQLCCNGSKSGGEDMPAAFHVLFGNGYIGSEV